MTRPMFFLPLLLNLTNLMPKLPSRYWSIGRLINTLEPCTNFRTGKIPSRGRQQSQHSVLGNSQQVGARFGHFQTYHTQEQDKRESTTGPQTCLTIKNLNKCSIDKLCLMITLPIDRKSRKETERKYLHV